MPRTAAEPLAVSTIARISRTLHLTSVLYKGRQCPHIYVMDGTHREQKVKLPDAADERAAHLCSTTDVMDSDLDDTFRAALLAWPAVSGSPSSSEPSRQRFSSELQGLATPMAEGPRVRTETEHFMHCGSGRRCIIWAKTHTTLFKHVCVTKMHKHCHWLAIIEYMCCLCS